MFESCVEIRSLYSDYLDGLCGPEELRNIRFHLTYCDSCSRELERCQMVQEDLRSLPRQHVPPEVALRLRVRLSQQIHRNLFGQLWVRLENALRPLLLPASGGLLASVICFGLTMGLQVVPETNVPDVPLPFATPPRVKALAPIDFSTGDQAVVVVTQVDAGGRVTGYRVLSGQHSPELMYRLDRMMYFSLFDPATNFGRPTDGRVVLSLRRITVRG